MTLIKKLGWILLAVCGLMVVSGAVAHAAAIVNIGEAEARVTYLEGAAAVRDGRTGTELPLALGKTLREGDEIATREKTRMELTLADGARLRFAGNTRFKIEGIQCSEKSKMRMAKVRMLLGRSWASIQKMWGIDSTALFYTDYAVAAVRGTVYRMNVEETQETLVRVYEGEVAVSSSAEGAIGKDLSAIKIAKPTVIEGPKKVTMEEWTFIIKAMYEIRVGRDGAPAKPQSFTAEQDRDDWVDWNKARDANPETPDLPPDASTATDVTGKSGPGDRPEAESRERQSPPDTVETETKEAGTPAGEPSRQAPPKDPGFFERLFGASGATAPPAPALSKDSRQVSLIKPPPIDLTGRKALTYKMTVAILPLENISNRPDLNWLSEGIPESLISRLQNVRSLHMVERMRIKRIIDELKLSQSGLIREDSVQKAGKLLGADTVIVGSFSEFQGTVRIRVRLVKVETGSILYAEEATGLLNRIFPLQDRLAEKLTASLDVSLVDDERQRLSQTETNSMKAYEAYVRGRDHYFQFNRAGYEKAVELYRDAIRLDTNYALAYAGIGDALATLAYSRKKAGESYASLLKEAKDAAKRAIALAPNMSDGYRALAHVFNSEFDFHASRRDAERALALNPNDAEAWYLLGQAATTVPDLDRAQTYYENAIRLNPDYAMAYNSLGWYVYLEKKWYDKAVEAFQRAIQISPDFTDAHDSLGEAYFRMGKYEEAAAAFRKALDLQPIHRHATQRYRETMEKLRK